MKYLCLSFVLILTGCLDNSRHKSSLKFRDIKQERVDTVTRQNAEAERQRNLEIEKKNEMESIVQDAISSYSEIEPIIHYKCSSCHDSRVKLPFYGRIFRSINPVNRHQVEGLKALDFVKTFPLNANGSPSQISLLKSIRNETQDRTMPLKSFTLVYPSKKIFDEDEQKIIAWVDPIIQRLENYEHKYGAQGVEGEGKALLEQKCFRCHANGNHRGDFGGMEDFPALSKSKYIDRKDPATSKLLTICVEGKMPPKKQEQLTQAELQLFRDWIELQIKKNP